MHPLALTRSIVDPIHGLVRMTAEEHAVMGSRVFQRLRKIKQNGLLHLVFPSATHTRFEHSLGVLFVADSVLQALLFNSLANLGKLRGLLDARDGQAVRFAELAPDLLAQLFRVTRLAALVHDLGHGPFSHSFEQFAPARARMRALLGAPELAPLAPLHEVLLAYNASKHPDTHPLAHEAMSALLFARIWHELREADPKNMSLEPWVPLAVAAAILGREALTSDLRQVPEALRPWLPLINDIVASAPVDADRMDYMERDSRSCGVTYGIFDRDRVLKSALAYRATGTSFKLGWKRSGLRAIEVFVQARFQLYAQIYYHKTNSAANMMMRHIAGSIRDAEVPLFDAPTFAALVDIYCDLGDDRFLLRLCEDPKLPAEARALAQRLERRELYARVYEATGVVTPRHMKKLMCGAYDRDKLGPRLRLDRARLDATKGLEDGAALLEQDEHSHYAARRGNWLEASPLLAALHREEQAIERLYWTGPREEVVQLRARARWLASEPAADDTDD